ncbi:MAG TPA: class IV adenylate cyclase [Tepidisphaeraceae bacterium]|jgi:adenylate cyclase class 2
MSVEIEAKMKVSDLSVVRAKLPAAGAVAGAKYFEINAFFDTEDRSLLAADHGLRLRINRDEATGKQTYVYTFKGPRQPGALKSREEIELDVGDPKAAEKFLGALGYAKVLSFEKRREKWSLGGCSVELDELPHLGLFVEIEGPSEAAIMAVRKTLGLDQSPIIKTSYVAMLMSYLQDQGSHDRTVTFPAA